MASLPGDSAWTTPGFTVQGNHYPAPSSPVLPDALPGNLSVVTVVGTFLDAVTHQPLTGTIHFRPSLQQIHDITDDSVVVMYHQAVALNAAGQFSIPLLATNDPDATPEFVYEVTEGVVGGRTYAVAVPYDSTSPIDITDLPQNTEVAAGSAILYMRGEQGAIGPQGPPGSGSVIFTQASPSASWLITHSFGRVPSVTVYDSSGEIIDADVTATSTQVTVVWPSPTTGTAILN